MLEISIVGTVHDISGGVPVPLPGWHVNATGRIAALDAHEVSPAAPQVVFAGVPTRFYRFDSREQFEQLIAGLDLRGTSPSEERPIVFAPSSQP